MSEVIGGGILGKHVQGPRRHLDAIALPLSCSEVTFTSDEVTAVCPITGQPDMYVVTIYLTDTAFSLESKALKLFFQSFRSSGIFCESFSALIAQEVHAQTLGHVKVTVVQKARGGITITAVSEELSYTERLEVPCVLHQGKCDTDGYGLTNLHGETRAHRASWVSSNGEIPEDKYVLHHCDTPPCINEYHLYLGTPAQNVRDRELRQRRQILIGEEAPRAKLSNLQVEELRKRYSTGEATSILEQDFNISYSTISDIVRGLSYKEAKGPLSHKRPGGSRLTKAEVQEIRRRYAEGGSTQSELALEFNRSIAAISLLVNNRTWTSQ